jgi:hypothetical protein
MSEDLTPRVLADLWAQFKKGQKPPDEELASFQKYMVLHENMHAHWDRLLKEPAASLVVDGEDLMLHIAMDVSTEQSLKRDEPSGIMGFFQTLTANGFDEGSAFHVLSQAMQHEFLEAASRGEDMDLSKFLARAAEYCRQALSDSGRSGDKA